MGLSGFCYVFFSCGQPIQYHANKMLPVTKPAWRKVCSHGEEKAMNSPFYVVLEELFLIFVLPCPTCEPHLGVNRSFSHKVESEVRAVCDSTVGLVPGFTRDERKRIPKPYALLI